MCGVQKRGRHLSAPTPPTHAFCITTNDWFRCDPLALEHYLCARHSPLYGHRLLTYDIRTYMFMYICICTTCMRSFRLHTHNRTHADACGTSKARRRRQFQRAGGINAIPKYGIVCMFCCVHALRCERVIPNAVVEAITFAACCFLCACARMMLVMLVQRCLMLCFDYT